MKKQLASIALGLSLAAATLGLTVAPALAADVDVSTSTVTGTAQSTVELNKTEEAVPVFTVSVPATIELGKDAVKVPYTLTAPDDSTFIPTGKKVSVKIQSAGYPGTLTKFAVWNKKALEEQPYELIYSPRMANPTPYAIGDEIVSWDGSNHGTQTCYARLTNNYDSIKAGTYTGVINYTISLEDK